jgi:phosphonate transport system substrate-binding protein
MNVPARSFAALAIVLAAALLAGTAAAQQCLRGDLDQRYCDEDGDLVADRPKDPKQWQNPTAMVFS